jgi:hypothetical protein
MSYNFPDNIPPVFPGLKLKGAPEDTQTYALKPPSGFVGDVVLTLPPVISEKDYVLKNDGLGNLTWTIQGALSSQGSVKKLTLSAPAGLLTDLTFTFPGTAGSAGNVLATDGAGGLSWVPQGGGGGGSVTGVFGTAGQIASSGGSAPVISLLDIAGLTPNPYAFPSSITVDAKGRVTAITGGSAPLTAISGTAGQVTVSNASPPVIGLATVAGVAGSYTSANITVDSFGRVTVASNGTGGAGAPADAEYLVLTGNGGLTNEKVLGLSANLTSSTVGSTYTLDLSSTGVVAGAYSYASITVDAKGRITSINDGQQPLINVLATAGQTTVSSTLSTRTVGLATAGTPNTYAYPSSVTTDAYGRVTSVTAGSAPASTAASFIVASSEASLSNDRVLAVSSDLTKTDGGGGGNMTLGLADTAIVAGTYTNPGSVTVDAKGRLTGISSGISALPIINTGLTVYTSAPETRGIQYFGFDTKSPSDVRSLADGFYTFVLPTGAAGDVIYVKDEGGAAQSFRVKVLVKAQGSLIDFAATTYTLDQNYESAQFICVSPGNWVTV